ncbi:hypothetical protein OJ253_1119 [Cryptosporidium canis]|uniref:Rnh202 triple barrel domain-containing protein n=1 Tax=Cryptosporidium canis TaxID=195482 RepID=A0A9D5DN12_9CRYT|nr:hypothetical protein OJ253_1119 [Cryptosporidium canis]
MEHKHKKFVVFPDTNTNLDRNLKVVTLPHPSVNTLCEYLYDSNHGEVFEIQEMTERYDGVTPSAFFGNECISKVEFCGAMAVDCFFFLLSALAFARSKQYINKKLSQVVSYYIINLKLELEQSEFSLFDQHKSNIQEMFQIFISNKKLLDKVEQVCDVSRESQMSENLPSNYTLNDEKLLEYLSERVRKAAKIASERKLIFKEYYNESKVTSPLALQSSVPAQEIACDLLFACIPKILTNIIERLKRRFGELKVMNEPENVEKSGAGSDKRTKSQFIGVKKAINKRTPPIIPKPALIKKAPSQRPSKPINSSPNGNILSFLKKK